MVITIVYHSGCIEDFATPPLGTSFGGGCVMDNAFLHVDDMYGKGIRLSTAYYGTHSSEAEQAVMREHVLVEPEALGLVHRVLKDNQEIMGQDGAGRLLNPLEYEAFLREAASDER